MDAPPPSTPLASITGHGRRHAQPSMDYKSIDEAFPDIDPECKPLGERILVQLRQAKQYYGQIALPDEVQETDKWNSQVAKVIDIGTLAFHDRETMQPWKEGAWCKIGDFVRVPKYGGDRFEMVDDKGEKVHFVIVKDLEIIAHITGDPLKVVAFI